MIANVINLLFITYTIMLFAKILGSWFPRMASTKIMIFISHYTDPYLGLFRKIVPPIGGVLDISPILAFFSLKVLKIILLSLL